MNNLYKRAKKKVIKEYFRFKRTNLRYAKKSEIWDIAHKVHFYCTVKEYFCLKPSIPRLYLELAIVEPEILLEMWNTYLRHEELQYQTWEDIEEIIEKLLLEWKTNAA